MRASPGNHGIMTRIKTRKWTVVILLLTVFILGYLLYSVSWTQTPSSRMKTENLQYSLWPDFPHTKLNINYDWFYSKCLMKKTDLSMDTLYAALGIWKTADDSRCRDLYQRFTSIFTVTEQHGSVVFPESFAAKVRGWLGNNEELFKQAKDQSIIFLYNEYTREQNVYNPIREKRPIAKPEQPERELMTSEDVFGRIETKHAFSASSAFKLDGWHGMIITRKHHPMNWTNEEFLDLMNASMLWLWKAYEVDKQFKYPMIVWDMMTHAGASQVHPHLHTFLDKQRYQGAVENWHLAAQQYSRVHPGRNYFTDIVKIHLALGLAVQYRTAFAFANVLPKRDYEIVIMSEKADQDFFQMFYFVLRAYIEELETFCFSLGGGFPSLDEHDEMGRIPAFIRVASRGPVATIRADASSLDLYLSPNVNTNPFKAIAAIKKAIQKRSGS